METVHEIRGTLNRVLPSVRINHGFEPRAPGLSPRGRPDISVPIVFSTAEVQMRARRPVQRQSCRNPTTGCVLLILGILTAAVSNN